MNYSIEHAAEIPINILHQCLKAKIEFLRIDNSYQLDLSMFFMHYYAQVSFSELDTAKDVQQLFQSKWIDLINELHEDLAEGRALRLKKEKDKNENQT